MIIMGACYQIWLWYYGNQSKNWAVSEVHTVLKHVPTYHIRAIVVWINLKRNPVHCVDTNMVIVIKFKTCNMIVWLVFAEDNGHQKYLKGKRILADRD